MIPDFIYIIIWIILMIAAAVFSAAETAFVSANLIRIKQLANNGNKRAIKTYHIVKDFSEMITAVLICNNIVSILATSIATYLFSRYFSEVGVLLSTIFMTISVLLFGELTPKIFAKERAEEIALALTPFMGVLIKIFSPIIKVTSNVSDHLSDEEDKVTATEEELLQIVQTIEQEGVLEQEERELIESAITFADKTVREIMRPVSATIFLYDNATPEQVFKTITEHKFSRIPVVSYDTLQAVGIIRERDILDLLINKKEINIKELIHPTIAVSQWTHLPDILENLQKRREHIAIVVENKSNNNFVGIVTLEDILEELVGEIYDEYDVLPNYVIEIGHHTYEIKGIVPIKQFFDERLDEDPPDTDARNFASWIEELAEGKKIKVGKTYEFENYIMKVLTMDHNRVASLELEVLSKNEESWEE